ncbi:MAG TPA: prephenate dehydrogenase [Bacilli bacterium]
MRIAIFGVGLIGGSLALCFKNKPGLHVVGHSPRQSSVEKMLKREVVDEATTSFEAAAVAADVIFLCVPVGNLEDYLVRLNRLPLKEGCIITDVGSTKQAIMACAQTCLRPGVRFIGGHPMAGKEKSGIEAASSYLFENAYYVLTPGDSADEAAYGKLVELLALTKAQIVRMNADMHDSIVGAISHLPHIIAVALVNLVAGHDRRNHLYSTLAAGGFRDLTRIASSDPIIWRDILASNRDVVLKLLHEWNDEINRFMKLIEENDGAGIEREFVAANRFRSELPERRKGVLTAMFDIYVEVPDQPGIIGKIASHLGDHKINLSNIQIMESRLDVPGALRLTFREEEDMAKAAELIKQMGCNVHY